jgi:hypothetical protein
MLTRRGFAGIASFSITGFVATNPLAAEGVPMTPGLTGQDALSGNRWRRVARLPISARRCQPPTRVRPPGERI